MAFYRESKGDEAYRRGEPLKALLKYKAAINKTVNLRNMEDFSASVTDIDDRLPYCHPLRALLLKLYAKTARTYLMLADFKETCSWAETALKTKHYCNFNFPAENSWSTFSPPHYQTAYRSKAIALESIGKLDGAIGNMEKALECDPGDAHVHDRLLAMRNIQRKVESH